MNRLLLTIIVYFFVLNSFAKSINIVHSKDFCIQLVRSHCTYVISDTIDLEQRTVELPLKSKFKILKGGYLKNGLLISNNSTIEAGDYEIFSNISSLGQWENRIVYGSWVGLKENGVDNLPQFKLLTTLCSGKTLTNLFTPKGIYFTSAVESSAPIIIPDNVYWHNESQIQLLPNSFEKYNLVLLDKIVNVTIDGGFFVGDLDSHVGNKGEWGHGVKLGGSSKVKLMNFTCKNFWGDGIDIIEGRDEEGNALINCNQIDINNVNCINNRRQGLSIEAGCNIRIVNSTFAFTGMSKHTSPCAGIDIEPWCNNTRKVWNISITGCKSFGNRGGDFICRPNVQMGNDYLMLHNKIKITNSSFGIVKMMYTNGLDMFNCIVSNKFDLYTSDNIIIKKCKIGKFYRGKNLGNITIENCDDYKLQALVLFPIGSALFCLLLFCGYHFTKNIV